MGDAQVQGSRVEWRTDGNVHARMVRTDIGIKAGFIQVFDNLLDGRDRPVPSMVYQ